MIYYILKYHIGIFNITNTRCLYIIYIYIFCICVIYDIYIMFILYQYVYLGTWSTYLLLFTIFIPWYYLLFTNLVLYLWYLPSSKRGCSAARWMGWSMIGRGRRIFFATALGTCDILIGGLEHFLFFHILGKSSQLTFIFFRGVETTNQDIFHWKWCFF